MRARHRHFNPRFAGADLVLDARYIDQSDNTAVSTWADRSGNAYNATQATAGNQPTFQTAKQGGCGGVDFDGSNDFMIGTYNPTAVPRTFHAVIRGDGGTYGLTNFSGAIWQVPQVASSISWFARWGTNNVPTTNIAGDLSINVTLQTAETNHLDALIGSWSSDSSRVVSFARDGVSKTVLNTPTSIASPTTNGYKIGEAHNSGFRGENFNGRIFSIHVWGDEQITAPLRKRCEHASAFSFKIACS